MSEKNNRTFHIDSVQSALWRNWALGAGAISLPLLLGLWIPMFWIAIITVVEAWVLVVAMKSNYKGMINTCSLLLHLATRILITSALIMMGIVILCTDWLVPTVIHLQLYNSEIPFITCLIVFPCTIFFCLTWLYAGLGDTHCRDCQRRNGYYAGDNIAVTLYYKETRYQVILLLSLAILLGAIEYWYYFARYINSDFNAPDHFFFNFMPTAVYLLSLLFMYGRYVSMGTLYKALDPNGHTKRNRTVVRFLIFCGDELLAHLGPNNLFDTPAEKVINRTRSISENQARFMLQEMMPIENFSLRYCFTNDGFAIGSNIIHYAAFLPENLRDSVPDDDVWMNPYMLDAALAQNSLNPVFANELFRLHTITMAWKTYDRKGRRLYPIRHYRPTFRFRDLPNWDVDYDDETWFDIANNNEDRKFYRLRNFWNNITDVFNRKTQAPDGR